MQCLAFISPDEAIMRLLAGPLIISAIALLITIPVAIRRRNMAINDPEKYRRMVAYEEEERERHKKRMAEAAATGATAARVIAKFLKK